MSPHQSAPQVPAPGVPRAYFPGLDGLRFLAAAAVVFHHMEQDLGASGLPSLSENMLVKRMGPQGVRFFFVLSGYLITYLLLLERERTGGISVAKFYVRRILRIWPLYYLIVGLGLWVFPGWPQLVAPHSYDSLDAHRGPITTLFLLILPNLALDWYGAVPHIAMTWSIGVEEQFYLVWPVLMRWVKRPLLVIAGAFCLFPGLQILLTVVKHGMAVDADSVAWRSATALASQPFYNMILGALAACAHHGGWRSCLRLLFSRPMQIATLVAIPTLLASPINLGRAASLLLSGSYAVLILNVAANPASVVRFDWEWMRWLGRISYGVYMYHAFLVNLSLYVVRCTLGDPPFLPALLAYYALATTLTIGVSWLSYTWFEGPLLALKDRFAVVQSGPR